MLFGYCQVLKFTDISLTDEETPRKNFVQEICPDRGSNTDPLCGKCERYPETTMWTL